MGVIRYDIKEAAYQEQPARPYELSILPGVDSSSYILTNNEHEVVAARSIAKGGTAIATASWIQLLESLPAQVTHQRRVRVGWLGTIHTLVPRRLYNPAEQRTYLAQLTVLDDTTTVTVDAIEKLGLYLVYAVESDTLQAMEHYFSTFRGCHLAAALLNQWAFAAEQRDQPGVYVHVLNGSLRIAALHQSRLHFFNAFTYQDARDFLYYVLLAYRQCEWSPAEVPLYLCGEIVENFDIYRHLYRYLASVEFLALPTGVAVGPQLQQQPAHFYYDLVSLYSFQP